jgi:hypothetical protein
MDSDRKVRFLSSAQIEKVKRDLGVWVHTEILVEEHIDRLVVELYRAGETWQAIADVLEVSRGEAIMKHRDSALKSVGKRHGK